MLHKALLTLLIKRLYIFLIIFEYNSIFLELKPKEGSIKNILSWGDKRKIKQLAKLVMAENQVSIHTPRKEGETHTTN